MTKKNVKHIRLKLVGLFIIIIIVLIAILTRVLYLDYKEDLKNDIDASIKDYVQFHKDSIDIFLKGHENRLKEVAKNDHIINIEESSVTMEESLQILENLQKSDDGILNVYMGTETGNMYLYPPVNLPEWFIAKDRPWYISALNVSSTFWTDPYVDAGASILIISNALKVENNGYLIGVVASDISLYNLINTLKENSDSEKNELIIISSSGRYILHPNHELIGLEVLDEGLLSKISNDSGTFEYEPFKNMKAIPEEVTPWEKEIYNNLKIQSVKYAYYEKNSLDWTIIGLELPTTKVTGFDYYLTVQSLFPVS